MRESTVDDSESPNASSAIQSNVAPAKVAVIGSGPAGLAAADYLNRAGVQVTVFEQAHRAGGLLTYGIPSMKLDKATVQATIDRLSAAGIIFKLDYQVIKERSQELLEGFDALIVCGGARKPRMPKINPECLSGLYPAMDYLVYTTQRQLGETPENPLLEGAGKHIVVVGNGDTATDCVATAVRQKAASITQLYYRVKPSDQRSASQPWPLYPKLFKTEYGQAEAAYVYGQDPREFAVNPTGVRGQDGRIDTLVIQDTQWQMVDGKNTMSYVEGTERQIPADLILIATGFAGPEDTLCETFALERDRRSNVAGQDGSHQTNVANIFTAGDMHTGQSLVVSAIKDGLEAAKECYNYICALK
jgi:glutamate synthase (NADPH/NADH) small chain